VLAIAAAVLVVVRARVAAVADEPLTAVLVAVAFAVPQKVELPVSPQT
jgi:hypothetical protein